uniref:Non-specific serine/threonine protein kinase n=1 Tax=Mesocestoides corti TaxID=53468 RepID=A0A5K3F3S9_MESCO
MKLQDKLPPSKQHLNHEESINKDQENSDASFSVSGIAEVIQYASEGHGSDDGDDDETDSFGLLGNDFRTRESISYSRSPLMNSDQPRIETPSYLTQSRSNSSRYFCGGPFIAVSPVQGSGTGRQLTNTNGISRSCANDLSRIFRPSYPIAGPTRVSTFQGSNMTARSFPMENSSLPRGRHQTTEASSPSAHIHAATFEESKSLSMSSGIQMPNKMPTKTVGSYSMMNSPSRLKGDGRVRSAVAKAHSLVSHPPLTRSHLPRNSFGSGSLGRTDSATAGLTNRAYTPSKGAIDYMTAGSHLQQRSFSQVGKPISADLAPSVTPKHVFQGTRDQNDKPATPRLHSEHQQKCASDISVHRFSSSNPHVKSAKGINGFQTPTKMSPYKTNELRFRAVQGDSKHISKTESGYYSEVERGKKPKTYKKRKVSEYDEDSSEGKALTSDTSQSCSCSRLRSNEPGPYESILQTLRKSEGGKIESGTNVSPKARFSPCRIAITGCERPLPSVTRPPSFYDTKNAPDGRLSSGCRSCLPPYPNCYRSPGNCHHQGANGRPRLSSASGSSEHQFFSGDAKSLCANCRPLPNCCSKPNFAPQNNTPTPTPQSRSQGQFGSTYGQWPNSATYAMSKNFNTPSTYRPQPKCFSGPLMTRMSASPHNLDKKEPSFGPSLRKSSVPPSDRSGSTPREYSFSRSSVEARQTDMRCDNSTRDSESNVEDRASSPSKSKAKKKGRSGSHKLTMGAPFGNASRESRKTARDNLKAGSVDTLSVDNEDSICGADIKFRDSCRASCGMPPLGTSSFYGGCSGGRDPFQRNFDDLSDLDCQSRPQSRLQSVGDTTANKPRRRPSRRSNGGKGNKRLNKKDSTDPGSCGSRKNKSQPELDLTTGSDLQQRWSDAEGLSTKRSNVNKTAKGGMKRSHSEEIPATNGTPSKRSSRKRDSQSKQSRLQLDCDPCLSYKGAKGEQRAIKKESASEPRTTGSLRKQSQTFEPSAEGSRRRSKIRKSGSSSRGGFPLRLTESSMDCDALRSSKSALSRPRSSRPGSRHQEGDAVADDDRKSHSRKQLSKKSSIEKLCYRDNRASILRRCFIALKIAAERDSCESLSRCSTSRLSNPCQARRVEANEEIEDDVSNHLVDNSDKMSTGTDPIPQIEDPSMGAIVPQDDPPVCEKPCQVEKNMDISIKLQGHEIVLKENGENCECPFTGSNTPRQSCEQKLYGNDIAIEVCDRKIIIRNYASPCLIQADRSDQEPEECNIASCNQPPNSCRDSIISKGVGAIRRLSQKFSTKQNCKCEPQPSETTSLNSASVADVHACSFEDVEASVCKPATSVASACKPPVSSPVACESAARTPCEGFTKSANKDSPCRRSQLSNDALVNSKCSAYPKPCDPTHSCSQQSSSSSVQLHKCGSPQSCQQISEPCGKFTPPSDNICQAVASPASPCCNPSTSVILRAPPKQGTTTMEFKVSYECPSNTSSTLPNHGDVEDDQAPSTKYKSSKPNLMARIMKKMIRAFSKRSYKTAESQTECVTTIEIVESRCVTPCDTSSCSLALNNSPPKFACSTYSTSRCVSNQSPSLMDLTEDPPLTLNVTAACPKQCSPVITNGCDENQKKTINADTACAGRFSIRRCQSKLENSMESPRTSLCDSEDEEIQVSRTMSCPPRTLNTPTPPTRTTRFSLNSLAPKPQEKGCCNADMRGSMIGTQFSAMSQERLPSLSRTASRQSLTSVTALSQTTKLNHEPRHACSVPNNERRYSERETYPSHVSYAPKSECSCSSEILSKNRMGPGTMHCSQPVRTFSKPCIRDIPSVNIVDAEDLPGETSSLSPSNPENKDRLTVRCPENSINHSSSAEFEDLQCQRHDVGFKSKEGREYLSPTHANHTACCACHIVTQTSPEMSTKQCGMSKNEEIRSPNLPLCKGANSSLEYIGSETNKAASTFTPVRNGCLKKGYFKFPQLLPEPNQKVIPTRGISFTFTTGTCKLLEQFETGADVILLRNFNKDI